MAKKLSSLIARQDYEGREIKCLIIEDRKAGTLRKEYEHENFKKIMDTVDKDDIVIVFAPTEEQRGKLIDLVGKNITPEGTTRISDEDLFMNMFGEFTDLDVSDLEADKVLLRQALDNPSELCLAIKSVLEQILWGIVSAYSDAVKTIEAIPEDVLKMSNNVKRLEMEAEKERILKQIEALQKELENVEG